MRRKSFQAWRNDASEKAGYYIPDSYVAAADVLRMLREYLSGLTWRAKLEELAPGPGSEEAEAVLRSRSVGTDELLRVLPSSIQIIDGELDGYDPNGRLAIILRAVDSTWWDVESTDERILRTIAETFPDAIDTPE